MPRWFQSVMMHVFYLLSSSYPDHSSKSEPAWKALSSLFQHKVQGRFQFQSIPCQWVEVTQERAISGKMKKKRMDLQISQKGSHKKNMLCFRFLSVAIQKQCCSSKTASDHNHMDLPTLVFHSQVLKICLLLMNTIGPVILNLINNSLATGCVQTCIKQATVQPLIKKPSLDPTILSNYMPILKLPFPPKVSAKVTSS